MKNYHYLYLLPLLFSFSCNPDKKVETEQSSVLPENRVQLTTEQLKNTNIETGVLTQKDISSKLKLNGIIDVPPQNLFSVSVPLGGYLQSTHLLEGLKVKKGEIIATIEDQQYIEIQQDYLTVATKYLKMHNRTIYPKRFWSNLWRKS